MGRLEKIVVLTVLFLVAVILAISLNQGDKKAPGANPMASVDPNQVAQGQATPGAPGSDGAADAAVQPLGAMNAAVQPQPNPTPGPGLNKPAAQPTNPGANAQGNGGNPTAAIKPITAPVAGSMLKTRDGLEESLFNDLYVYTWKAGDTYPTLAERFYGSQKLALRLRTANEGRTEATLKVGDKIFVPNLEAATPALQGGASNPADASAPLAANGAGSSGGAKKNGVSADGYYVVQKGDMLGTISTKVYGTSKKWQKIFDANRDVLKDANSVSVGMKLRIPE